MSTDQDALFETADQFIDLANRLARQDASGTVGAALRYAAARYSAFEASLMSDDLENEHARMQALFGDEFARMLATNLQAYSRRAESAPQAADDDRGAS